MFLRSLQEQWKLSPAGYYPAAEHISAVTQLPGCDSFQGHRREMHQVRQSATPNWLTIGLFRSIPESQVLAFEMSSIATLRVVEKISESLTKNRSPNHDHFRRTTSLLLAKSPDYPGRLVSPRFRNIAGTDPS